MEVSNVPQLIRNTGRFREVVHVLAKYGLAGFLTDVNLEWVRSLFKTADDQQILELSPAARIRLAITELGTTFIKLGQVLSTRPDLVGQEIANELAQLRAGTPADPPDVIKELIETELGSSIEELYAEFEAEAFASASIGQVHRAVLHDGSAVVVKVQHPGIEDGIKNDLEILKMLAELAESHAPQLRQYRPVDTTTEFQRTLLRELDFRSEQRNLDLFRRNFRDDLRVVFPMPYQELSSRRVLTMQRLDGVNISEPGQLNESGLPLSEFAKRGASIFLDMIFRDAFYHADPHPGNLMIVPGQDSADSTGAASVEATSPAEPYRIGVLDCGMVGRMDEAFRQDIESALLAVVHHDSQTLTDVIVRLGSAPLELDREELMADVEDFLSVYAHQSLNEFDLSGCLQGIIDIIHRYKIVLHTKMAMLLKVLIMLEGTAQLLNPEFNLAEMIAPYGQRSMQDRFSPKRLFRRLQATYDDWNRLAEILPRDAADILHRIKSGRFNVYLEHRRLEATVNRLVLGILTAALYMGSAMLWSRGVGPTVQGISLPGISGCLVACYLGFIVIRAVKSTGDLRD